MHAGVQLSKEDVRDLKMVGSECIGKALPDLVGWTRHMKPVKSGIHTDLVKQASLPSLTCCKTDKPGLVPGLKSGQTQSKQAYT